MPFVFSHPQTVVWTNPRAESLEAALRGASHLAIGAHHDDLEFMAFEGIAAGQGPGARGFAGIVCTDGRGSARAGTMAETTLDELMRIRIAEQQEAAQIGNYATVIQLGYPSTEAGSETMVRALAPLLELSGAEVVYTHNPADKHPTHIAVFSSVLKALRSLPAGLRPRRLVGCEVWRDLDWMPDGEKVRMDVSAHADLAEKLNSVFVSQISGGKRYDLAVAGRRRANATFADPREGDDAAQVIYGMDLTPLLLNDALDPVDYVCGFIRRFEQEVRSAVKVHFQS